MAAKGSWEMENVFVMYLNEIGNIYLIRISMTFVGDEVVGVMTESTSAGEIPFTGRVQR